MSTAMPSVRAAAPAQRVTLRRPSNRVVQSSRCVSRHPSRRQAVVVFAQAADKLNSGQTKSQLTANAPGDTPENVLRVSRGTSFEGLKSAYGLALEAAEALDGDDDEKVARVTKVEWAFDCLIAESRVFFTKSVEAAPNDANAVFRLGNFYQTLGKLKEAETEYRKASVLDNTHVDAMNNLALCLTQMNKIDEAEAYFLRCVEIDNKCVDAMFNWATLKLEHRQDLDGCRVLIDQIVMIDPTLKEHKLVKALRAEDEETEEKTPFLKDVKGFRDV